MECKRHREVAEFFLLFLAVGFAALWVRACGMARTPKARFAAWRRFRWRDWYMLEATRTAAQAWEYLDRHKCRDVDGASIVLPIDEHPLNKAENGQ